MPGSTLTFSYTLRASDGDVGRLAAQARKVLGWACDGDKRITCHSVDGEALGVVQLNLTIVGRDQWWARQLGQDIINMVSWGLAHPAEVEILSNRQEPHTHRGYAHGRTKQWRERPSPQSA